MDEESKKDEFDASHILGVPRGAILKPQGRFRVPLAAATVRVEWDGMKRTKCAGTGLLLFQVFFHVKHVSALFTSFTRCSAMSIFWSSS